MMTDKKLGHKDKRWWYLDQIWKCKEMHLWMLQNIRHVANDSKVFMGGLSDPPVNVTEARKIASQMNIVLRVF